MKKKNNTIYLDMEEQKLLKAFERGEFVSVNNINKRRKEVSQAAKNTLAKNKRINIRMREEDLTTIKKKQKSMDFRTRLLSVHYFITTQEGKLPSCSKTFTCKAASQNNLYIIFMIQKLS